MAIRWKEYRNRRKLDIKRWSKNIGIKNYSDLIKHLWSVGVIPPERIDEDVVIMLGSVDDSPASKPTSGRRDLEEVSELDIKPKMGKLASKPTSGRKIENSPLDKSEKPSIPSKPKRTRRKRPSTKRRTSSTKKSSSKE